MNSHFGWILAPVLCSGIVFASGMNGTPPSPDEAVWSRIDKLNATLLKAPRPLPAKEFAEALQEARSLLRFETFDANYQEIRAWAFENDFSQAESLAKRAAPALTIDYTGDNDRYQINYSYFKSLVAAGSEPEEFLKAYRRYSNVLLTLNPSSGQECQFPFDFQGAEIKNAKAERTKAIARWKTFEAQWKEPILAHFAAQAVQCLASAK